MQNVRAHVVGEKHRGPLGQVQCSCAVTVQTVHIELRLYHLAVVRYKITLVYFLNSRDYCLKCQVTQSPILRTPSGYPPSSAFTGYPIDEQGSSHLANGNRFMIVKKNMESMNELEVEEEYA